MYFAEKRVCVHLFHLAYRLISRKNVKIQYEQAISEQYLITLEQLTGKYDSWYIISALCLCVDTSPTTTAYNAATVSCD